MLQFLQYVEGKNQTEWKGIICPNVYQHSLLEHQSDLLLLSSVVVVDDGFYSKSLLSGWTNYRLDSV